jgi:hypothetical protein
MRTLLFCLGLIASSAWSLCPGLSFEFSSSPPPDAFSQQGKELRAELERVYRDSKNKRHSLTGLDVSSTVGQYIPVGTSFDDAERILRAAGFKMAPRPPRPIDRDPAPEWEKTLRFTMMGGLDLDQTFLVSKTTVSVVLVPDSPGNPNAKVKEISASLMTTYL